MDYYYELPILLKNGSDYNNYAFKLNIVSCKFRALDLHI